MEKQDDVIVRMLVEDAIVVITHLLLPSAYAPKGENASSVEICRDGSVRTVFSYSTVSNQTQPRMCGSPSLPARVRSEAGQGRTT